MNNHCIFQCIDGSAYGFGYNKYGQLGRLSEKEFVPKPILLEFDFKCLDIALGHEHTLFLTTNHEVYVCGSNLHGQLGIPKIDRQIKPIKIMDNVKLIACGMRFSLVYTFDKKLYGFGRKIMNVYDFYDEQFQKEIDITNINIGTDYYLLYKNKQNSAEIWSLQNKLMNVHKADFIIKKITRGHRSLLFLNNFNQIYKFSIRCWDLPTENPVSDIIDFNLINMKIKDMSCTCYCTLYLTENNDVYYSGIFYEKMKFHIKEEMKLIATNVLQMISGSSYIILVKNNGKIEMISDGYSDDNGNSILKKDQWTNGEIIIDKKVSMINGKVIRWMPEYHHRLDQDFKDNILIFMMIYDRFKKSKCIIGKYVIFNIINFIYC